jgi:hypothetical protein
MTPDSTTSESSQLLSALPVRRRETLEIFDAALKLYRRHFGVLLGWSGLVSALSLLVSVLSMFVPLLWIPALFALPLLYGAVSCCVAAAVRGQKVTFSQCWAFSKPRYGAMLLNLVLTWLLYIVLGIVGSIAGFIIFFLSAFLIALLPGVIAVVVGIVGFACLMIAMGCLSVCMMNWGLMVEIIVCLEDDKRGVAALSRAFELLQGNWRRVINMSLLIGLAGIAVVAILVGLAGMLTAFSFSEVFSPNPSGIGLVSFIMTYGGLMAFFSLFWTPAQLLIVAVLYLDLRVRREALDLEWATYSTSPPAPQLNSDPTLQNAASTPLPYTADSSTAPLSAAMGASNVLPSQVSPTSLAAGGPVEHVTPPPPSLNLEKPTAFDNSAPDNPAPDNPAPDNPAPDNTASASGDTASEGGRE